MITLNLFHAILIIVVVVLLVYLLIKYTRIEFIVDNNSYRHLRSQITSGITEDLRQQIFDAQYDDIKKMVHDEFNNKSIFKKSNEPEELTLVSNNEILNRLKELISDELYLMVKTEINTSKNTVDTKNKDLTDVPSFHIEKDEQSLPGTDYDINSEIESIK